MSRLIASVDEVRSGLGVSSSVSTRCRAECFERLASSIVSSVAVGSLGSSVLLRTLRVKSLSVARFARIIGSPERLIRIVRAFLEMGYMSTIRVQSLSISQNQTKSRTGRSLMRIFKSRIGMRLFVLNMPAWDFE